MESASPPEADVERTFQNRCSPTPDLARYAPRHSPVRSHSLRVLSLPPDSAVRPSGENATEKTASECPVKVRSSLPVATSHSLSVLSQLPDSAVRPSGANATEETAAECLVKVRSSWPVATSQSLSMPSPSPESTVRNGTE